MSSFLLSTVLPLKVLSAFDQLSIVFFTADSISFRPLPLAASPGIDSDQDSVTHKIPLSRLVILRHASRLHAKSCKAFL